MIESLLASYLKGAITADHLAAECLHMIDPAQPSLVLDALPAEILTRVLDQARKYESGKVVSNYPILPAADQIEATREWIEVSRRMGAGGPLTSVAEPKSA